MQSAGFPLLNEDRRRGNAIWQREARCAHSIASGKDDLMRRDALRQDRTRSGASRSCL